MPLHRALLVMSSSLLVIALGDAIHTRRQLPVLERRHQAVERELRAATTAIRQRDSALALVRARVDTVRVPVIRYAERHVAARRPAEVAAAGAPLAAMVVTDKPKASPPLGCADATTSSLVVASEPHSSGVSRPEPLPLRQQASTVTHQASSARPILTYAALLTAGDLGNAWLRIDPDPGGYLDTWNTQDKLAHAAIGALLAQTAIEFGVRPPWAAALTCAGAAGYELSQHYRSRKDVIAGCAGAAVGAGLRWGASRLTGRSR